MKLFGTAGIVTLVSLGSLGSAARAEQLPPPDDLSLSLIRSNELQGQETGLVVHRAEVFQSLFLAAGTRRANVELPFGAKLLVYPTFFACVEPTLSHGGGFLPMPTLETIAMQSNQPLFVQVFALDPDFKRSKPLFSSNALEINAHAFEQNPTWNAIKASAKADLLRVPDVNLAEVHVRIKVPSKGYSLTAIRVARDSTGTHVFLNVIDPGPSITGQDRWVEKELYVRLEETDTDVRVYLGRTDREANDEPRVYDLATRVVAP